MASRAKDPSKPKLYGRNSPTHQRRAAAMVLAQQVFALRLHGYTFRAIGEQLGKCHATCRAAYNRQLDERRSELDVAREQIRATECAKLDLYLTKLAPRIDGGDEKAIDRAIKIAERRARLLGLDAPTMVAPVTPDGSQPYEPAGATEQHVLGRVLALIQTAKERRKTTPPNKG